MARVSLQDVKNIMDTSLDNSEIFPMINQANRIVTRQLSGEGMTSDQLSDIEMWLAAHLIAITKERQAESEQLQDARVQYQGNFGQALRSTTYGQMVITLDESGKLQRSTKNKVKIRAMKQPKPGDADVDQ